MPWAFQIITLAILVGYIGFNEYQKRNSDALMASELRAEIGALDGLEVRSLQVVDGTGRVRFEVKADDKDTDLSLFDLNGLRRLSMSSKHTETALSLYDREERLLTSLSEKEGASLEMFYESGGLASAFDINERTPGLINGPSLVFHNKDGQETLSTYYNFDTKTSLFSLMEGGVAKGNDGGLCAMNVSSDGSYLSLASFEDGTIKGEVRLDRADGASSLTFNKNNLRTALLGDGPAVDGGAFNLYRNDGAMLFDVAKYLDRDPFLRLSGSKKASAIMMAGRNDESVADSQFYLTDASGVIRSQLGIWPKSNSNGLYLLDKSSKNRVAVREQGGPSGLSIFGEDGSTVGELYQSNSKPSLYFMEDGKETLRVPSK